MPQAGRFVVYARGEFEGAPSAAGYSQALAQTLSAIDGTIYIEPATGLPVYFPQATIPLGPIGTATQRAAARGLRLGHAAESCLLVWQSR
jgi:hypothetical protein